jgi:Zn-dependent oligopeptidase
MRPGTFRRTSLPSSVELPSQITEQRVFDPGLSGASIPDRSTANPFRENVPGPFGTVDMMTQYVRFRGAELKIDGLLKKRGLEVKR